jgi:riboflavin biosynthesis pyrimidine reductase
MPNPPDRPQVNRGAPFESLFEAPQGIGRGEVRGGTLPEGFQRYGTNLTIPLHADRPTMIVNFVESLDGIVTFDPEHGSGAEISGFNEPDRFVMGLLRTLADGIVVGAGTVRAAPNHVWTTAAVHRASGEAAAAWRRELGLSPQPALLVVTAAGDVPAAHPALANPEVRVLILTTAAGRDRLAGVDVGAATIRIAATDDAGHVTGAAIVDAARSMGVRLLLSEGGPHLTATLVEANLVDELFLTVAPQVLGREGRPGERRYGLVEGVALPQDAAHWARLRSVRRSVDHLFLRYAFGVV